MGRASLSCSGLCSCSPITLDGAVAGKPKSRDKVSMHHVENIVLSPTGGAHPKAPSATATVLNADGSMLLKAVDGADGGSDTAVSGVGDNSLPDRRRCCVVSIETLPASARPSSGTSAAAARRKKRGGSGSGGVGSESGGSAFKVLSFFVGTTTAGTGRLHQQSIIMDLPGNS